MGIVIHPCGHLFPNHLQIRTEVRTEVHPTVHQLVHLIIRFSTQSIHQPIHPYPMHPCLSRLVWHSGISKVSGNWNICTTEALQCNSCACLQSPHRGSISLCCFMSLMVLFLALYLHVWFSLLSCSYPRFIQVHAHNETEIIPLVLCPQTEGPINTDTLYLSICTIIPSNNPCIPYSTKQLGHKQDSVWSAVVPDWMCTGHLD